MSTDLRTKLHALIDEIVNAIESSATKAEMVDQNVSPLGRDRHMRLVRSGKLRGHKDGRRVLVRREDIEAYLARKTVVKVDVEADEQREAARIAAEMSRRSA